MVSFFVKTMCVLTQRFLLSSFWQTTALLHWNILHIHQIWYNITFLFIKWNLCVKKHILIVKKCKHIVKKKITGMLKQLTESGLLYTFDQWKTRLYPCVSTKYCIQWDKHRIVIHINKGVLYQYTYLIDTPHICLLYTSRCV